MTLGRLCTGPRSWAALAAIFLLSGTVAAQRNVLLIIADDLGVDRVGAYGEHPDPGNTPVIDALATFGVLFRNAWSNPSCSPTRATMLTGRYSFRTGVGNGLNYTGLQEELSVDEVTLPKLLAPTHRTAAVGKWHLATEAGSGLVHPLLCGFEHHSGSIQNLPAQDGASAYFDYEKSVDGVLTPSTTYATTDAVDDALAYIGDFGLQPWFVWLAFNAPHTPYHNPPDHLHSFDLPPVGTDNPLHMKAAVEAMDTEIGRLILNIRPDVLLNTWIIFIGDNGTAANATTAPFIPGHAKPTVFEGGVNVPLIMFGPGGAVGECAALVNTTDIFRTILQLASVPPGAAGEDSTSLVPYLIQPTQTSIRPFAYAEWFFPGGVTGPFFVRQRALRDRQGFKLRYEYDFSVTPTTISLYDLRADPFEQTDLLLGPLTPAQTNAFNRLTIQMDVLDVLNGG